MKNKFLALTLLLSNATLFGAQGGSAAAKKIKLSDNGAAATADQQEQVRSLQDIAALSTLQMMKDEYPDIYKNPVLFEIALNNNTAIPQPVKNLLIAKYQQSKEITLEAAHLWVEHHARRNSPLDLLKEYKPKLAHLLDQGVPWNLSFQDIIDAGGADILTNKITDDFKIGIFKKSIFNLFKRFTKYS